MNSDIGQPRKGPSLGELKHVVLAINRENPSTGLTWTRAREKYSKLTK